MWAHIVHQAKVGPAPCSVKQLNPTVLAQKFHELKHEGTRNQARLLANRVAEEDGVQSGMQHFLDSLPRDNLCCDVALIMGESKVGRFRIQTQDAKVGNEVAAMLTPHQFARSCCGTFRCRKTTRLVRGNVHSYALGTLKTFLRGFASECSGCFAYVLDLQIQQRVCVAGLRLWPATCRV